MLAFIVTLIGGLIIYYVVEMDKSLAYNINLVHRSRALIWFMVPISTQIIIKVPFIIGKNNLKVIDQG
jgi:hypothetical protein